MAESCLHEVRSHELGKLLDYREETYQEAMRAFEVERGVLHRLAERMIDNLALGFLAILDDVLEPLGIAGNVLEFAGTGEIGVHRVMSRRRGFPVLAIGPL